jgi:hypothetical protein
MGDGEQFFLGEKLLFEGTLADDAIEDQHTLGAPERLVHLWRTVEQADDDPVDAEQRKRSDDASGDGVVVADDGVLHRIREREEHNQIEGVELGELALAEDAEENDERQVDDDRAQNLFKQRELHVEHVVKYACRLPGNRGQATGGKRGKACCLRV